MNSSTPRAKELAYLGRPREMVMEKTRSRFAKSQFCAWIVIASFLVIQSLVRVDGAPLVPAMFVIGDSLADNGNNNKLNTMAKANYYPYGIDFYQGPTGRFSNGKTIIDLLCEMLGLPYIPPSSSPNLNGTRLLGGVNYASAAAGILDETGQYVGERFSLNQQVLNFESNLDDLRVVLGGQSNLNQYLARSIVVVLIGGNDYINNYLLPSLYTSSYNYTPEEYANLLLNRLTTQLLALHNLGLRKFFLAGVGPLGCTPNQLATGLAPPGRCVDQVNQMLGFFNGGLRALAHQLNTNHPGAIFVYGNTYGALGDILNNPSAFGFKTRDQGCCGVGRNQGQITCLPYAVPCTSRSDYVFWDAFHPTQAVNAIIAHRAFTGPSSDCDPINIQQMAQL